MHDHHTGRGDLAPVWEKACATIRARIGDRNFSTWIAPLRRAWTDHALVLEAPDVTTRNLVERHFAAVIEGALAATLQRPCPVRLELAPAPPPLPIRLAPPPAGQTFDSFVVGVANVGAVRAANEVLAGGGALLFLHGPAGVGKTHLLRAVHHALEARGTRAGCLPAAELAGGLVEAYRGGEADRFWHDLRQLGALLLDDVHSLAGQEETQERLLEGLVGWVDAERLLAITSDRAPEQLPELSARLGDRFERGRIARVDPPDLPLRLAILARKASALGLTLASAVADRIAASCRNVRQLEGALTRLAAHAELLGKHVDAALADQVLPEIGRRPPAPLTADRILEATAAVFGVTTRALRGRSRRARNVLPRQVALFLARELLARPFAEVGAALGRDHTTALHAWRSIAAKLPSHPDLAQTIHRIEQRLATDEPARGGRCGRSEG